MLSRLISSSGLIPYLKSVIGGTEDCFYVKVVGGSSNCSWDRVSGVWLCEVSAFHETWALLSAQMGRSSVGLLFCLSLHTQDTENLDLCCIS